MTQRKKVCSHGNIGGSLGGLEQRSIMDINDIAALYFLNRYMEKKFILSPKLSRHRWK